MDGSDQALSKLEPIRKLSRTWFETQFELMKNLLQADELETFSAWALGMPETPVKA